METQVRTFNLEKFSSSQPHYEVSINRVARFRIEISSTLVFKDGPKNESSIFGYYGKNKVKEIGLVNSLKKIQWENFEWDPNKQEYRFGITLAGEGGRGNFVWKRTQLDGTHLANSHVFVLRDDRDAIVAVYSHNAYGMVRGGTLEVRVDMGCEFDKIIVMTCVAICHEIEKLNDEPVDKREAEDCCCECTSILGCFGS